MTTRAQPYTRAVFPAVAKVRPSAVLSGIVPDREHLDDGGYHCSLDDLRRHGNLGDYSSRRSLDKSPPVTAPGRLNACAIDISMSPGDMRATYKAVETVFKSRATDTRAKYINAINVWDGNPKHAPVRFNFQTGTKTPASRDHTWHAHADWVRVFVDAGYNQQAAERAARAMASTLTGQVHDAWLRQEHLGPYAPKPPAPKPDPAPADQEDDDMITNTYPVPAGYAYADDLTVLNAGALLAIGLPPAGHPSHRWGKNYLKPYLSVVADRMPPEGARLRVAINDGSKWHSSVVEIKAKQQGRIALTVPPPATANQAAYNISVGRVAPAGDAPPIPGAEDPAADIAIGIVVELIRNDL